MSKIRELAAAGCLLLLACSDPSGGADAGTPDGSDTDAGPFVCNVEAPTSCTDPDLSFSDIEPIIVQRCQICHSGDTEQWPLTSYSHVADWFDLIPPEVANCRMPPPEARIPISDEERLAILTWFRCGYPE